MFGLKELPYPPPKDTLPEDPKNLKPIGNTCELMQHINNKYSRAFIKVFCPWVDADSLSEEQVNRFASAAFYFELLETNRATITTPEDETAFHEIFDNLIPPPTEEQLQEYLKQFETDRPKEPPES